LLKLLLGFLQPDQGQIRLLGSAPSHSISKVSYVPQGLRFDRQFPISVMELVLSGRLSRLPWYGMYSAEDKQAAIEALDLVGMLSYKHTAFGNLSGGQAQRSLIARALVSEPELLLLDEPTASVDNKAEALIYSILKQLQKKMTILMVTHDLRAAIDIVDRVLCVQGGVLSLLPQEVCEHFALGLYHAPLQLGK
jgi:zinc transport system ATP-binding protein